MHVMVEIVAGLLPSIGIGYLFYRIMRLLLEGDRKERAAYARWQAEHDAEGGRVAHSPTLPASSAAEYRPEPGAGENRGATALD